MELIEGDTANDVWSKAGERLTSASDFEVQPSRCGDTRELLHVALSIRNPRERWIFSRRPVPNPAFAIAETFWILAGRNDAALPNFWNPKLPKFQGDGPTYHGAYGKRLRSAFGLDQIDRAYSALSGRADTRQVVMSIYHPALDLPLEDGSPVSPDVPCNVCSILKLRGGRLEWLQVMRSNDLIRGLPYNIVQFTMLQEVMAGWLGVDLGTYHHVSDSLHVYENDLAKFTVTSGSSEPRSTDRLALPKAAWNTVAAEFIETLDRLRMPDLDAGECRELALSRDRPQGYANLMKVAAADAARRHHWNDLAEEILEACANPALRGACDAWFNEQKRRSGRVRSR